MRRLCNSLINNGFYGGIGKNKKENIKEGIRRL